MLIIVMIAGVLILGFAALFTTAAVVFSRRARQPAFTRAGQFQPPCAILLAVRGADAHLEDCIRALCRQQYPTYTVRVTVDSEADPAWTVIRRVLHEQPAPHVRVTTLRNRSSACSLKCSALLQMTHALEDDVAVVALIDGDVVPHAGWLRDLVAPLSDPAIGATFGIPWHAPAGPGLGTFVCSHWWSLAAMTMALRGWPWGGSCALTLDTLRRCGIEDRWRTSLSSDTPLHGALADRGLSARWVPSVVVLNRERCSIRGFVPQLVRYIAVRRLYLPQWRRARVGGLLFGVAVLIAALTSPAAFWTGQVTAGWIAAGALVALGSSTAAMLACVDRVARRSLHRNRVPVPPRTVPVLLRAAVALPMLFPVVALAASLAQHARSVTWRGVRYTVRGANDVALTTDGGARP